MTARRRNPDTYYFSEHIWLTKNNAIGGEYIVCSYAILQLR